VASGMGRASSSIDLDATDEDSRVQAIKAATGRRGADVVIEAAGKIPAFSERLRLVGPAGRYLIVGLWSAPGTVALEPRAVNNANARIIGSALSRPRHLHQAIAVAQTHHERFPLTDVVSHRFALGEAPEALDALGRSEVIKAVIVPS
jgi:threonine dehydrogenase-like Zn-dependent dehydrogenase